MMRAGTRFGQMGYYLFDRALGQVPMEKQLRGFLEEVGKMEP